MKGYRTKRIALPGGRTIEIVYFYDSQGEASAAATGDATADPLTEPTSVAVAPADPPAPEAPADDAVESLHVCPECHGELVYPVAWEERGDDRWHIDLRCPSCEWRDAGEYAQDDVEEFDDILNDGTESLLSTLRSFTRANMEEDVDRLISAISTGLIQPMDF